jgi:peptidoglycan hydrolase-like protein with peptidoglycan-binding domain
MRASARTPTATVSSPEFLSAGATGPAVKQLQRALHMHVDGVFGSTTRAAVVRFQRQHRLTVDGVVGPQTRRALHLRVRVIQTPAPASQAVSSTAPASSSASSGYAIPASIVMCESGGNWSAVNPTTGAGGAYQIMPSTWAAYGGTGLPQNATPAEQSAIAAKIWAASGPGAWSC